MKASITIGFDERILDVFAQEDKQIGRASYTISTQNDTIVFDISAEDAAALRTIMNAITKLLSIWEDSQDL